MPIPRSVRMIVRGRRQRPFDPNALVVHEVQISPPAGVTVQEGQTVQLNATVWSLAAPAHGIDQPVQLFGRTVSWQSSDTNVATVDSNGLVTTINDGTVTITATCEGVTDTVDILSQPVTSPPVTVTAVQISPPSAAMLNGATTLQLQATASYSDGSSGPITAVATWSVFTALGDASVNSLGLVTSPSGTNTGNLVIRCSFQGVHQNVTIAVSSPSVVTGNPVFHEGWEYGTIAEALAAWNGGANKRLWNFGGWDQSLASKVTMPTSGLSGIRVPFKIMNPYYDLNVNIQGLPGAVVRAEATHAAIADYACRFYHRFHNATSDPAITRFYTKGAGPSYVDPSNNGGSHKVFFGHWAVGHGERISLVYTNTNQFKFECYQKINNVGRSADVIGSAQGNASQNDIFASNRDVMFVGGHEFEIIVRFFHLTATRTRAGAYIRHLGTGQVWWFLNDLDWSTVSGVSGCPSINITEVGGNKNHGNPVTFYKDYGPITVFRDADADADPFNTNAWGLGSIWQ